MPSPIAFNIPFVTGRELHYIEQAISNRKLSGDGPFTHKCQDFFQERFGFRKTFLTTSCTDALEMAALLTGIQPGDEVILPSFTFVSTANAFLLRGAKLVFADSQPGDPNVSAAEIERLVTPATKAIVVMHYAGMACDMDEIMAIANRKGLFVIEDAALGLDAWYKGKPLGSFGHLAAFSFHETKNISCGEGGLLVVNDERFIKRAEIIREKGTNRSAFFRGEIDKYGWADVGSSFLSSDILAAYLYAQLEAFDRIQQQRCSLWDLYHRELKPLEKAGKIKLPEIHDEKKHNGSIFYIACGSMNERTRLIDILKKDGIQTSFHYQALHKSAFYSAQQNVTLPNSETFSDNLLRLPLYAGLSESDALRVIAGINTFYRSL